LPFDSGSGAQLAQKTNIINIAKLRNQEEMVLIRGEDDDNWTIIGLNIFFLVDCQNGCEEIKWKLKPLMAYRTMVSTFKLALICTS
jgi:hypothetical protein